MYFHSQKQMKIMTNNMLPAEGVWRHVTSYAKATFDELYLRF